MQKSSNDERLTLFLSFFAELVPVIPKNLIFITDYSGFIIDFFLLL